MDERIRTLEPFWGAWYIKRPLGEGAYGTVFEIERKEFGNVFSAALKIVTIPHSQNDYKDVLSEGMSKEDATTYFRDMVEEMTREFALMDSVKGHTNIVDYSDHMVLERKDAFGWDILIRMELLTPLNDYLTDHTLSEDEVIELGKDICRALEICESANIIHRDIKPGNIFISKRGEYKLGDFGIARISDKTKGASTKVGTKNYLAPEVFRGEKYDKTVDIYALGIVMYQLLNNGRLPFYPPYPQKIAYSDKEEAIMKRMMGQDEFPAIDCVHKGLIDIIRKACAFEAKHRYQSAGQMLAELEKLNNSSELKYEMVNPVLMDKDSVSAIDGQGNGETIKEPNHNKIESDETVSKLEGFDCNDEEIVSDSIYSEEVSQDYDDGYQPTIGLFNDWEENNGVEKTSLLWEKDQLKEERIETDDAEERKVFHVS